MDIIIINLLRQILFSIGLISLFGLAIWLLNRVFYRLMGKHGRAAGIAAGCIGTPVHELGHAFFCVIFGHKIVELKLFQPSGKGGALGYVKHTFNKKNLYHQIGNFFIGTGPIIFGSGALWLLMLLLQPRLQAELIGKGNALFSNPDILSLSSAGYFVKALREIIVTFFSAEFLADPLWWLFMIFASSIVLHMSLSPADIKSSSLGFGLIAALLLIMNVILYFVNLHVMLLATEWFLRIGLFVISFLTLSIFILLILLFAALAVKGIKKALTFIKK